MNYDFANKKLITSPERVVKQNYRLGANYYLSIIIKEDLLEVCFPVSSGSTLVCFRVRGLVSENDFRGSGWLEKISGEVGIKIVVPPDKPGFYLGIKIRNKLTVSAYSKIFWEIPSRVKSKKTNWSETPAYYVSIGDRLPSIAFRQGDSGCFVGIGDTPDRAVLNVVHLSRIGESNLEIDTDNYMSRFEEVDNKVVRDNILMSIFNSNSKFVDNDDDCIIASKSPKYYVSSGFWARDFIFWTFPVIERYDPERARVLLSLLFTKYWKHRGIHSLYMDGRILYDGFELDQLSYYFLALERAIVHNVLTPEDTVTRTSQLMDILISRKSEEYNLFSTDLNSSDDPTTYPYVTFDNVALWYSMRTYALRVKDVLLDRTYLEYSEKIKEDIMKALVKDDMFSYSSDLNGHYEFYDDPTGSLLLFPYLGFIDKESMVFKNTVEWIKSDKNEFKIEGKFGGFGNRHVNQPWIHSYATQVLSGIGDRSVLENLSMDDGLSCETIDRETGRCLTGIHFPGSSAFLVQALLYGSKENGIRKTERGIFFP